MSIITNELLNNLNKANLSAKMQITGLVKSYEGNILECDGFPATIGSICKIESMGEEDTSAEIIGFRNNRNLLAMYNSDARIKVGSLVTLIDDGISIPVGENLLGRVIDGMGDPLDGKILHKETDTWPINGKIINPLQRQMVDKPLDVGVRIINSIITVGKGQRLGIIAGSGVGKSILLSMMSSFTEADVVVIALIGERAREVRSMVENLMSTDNSKKIIIVAVPADRSPLLRMRGANRSTAIAEYFRSKGKNVLLIMDSLTRVAHAKREIGLALGEHPTSKGYPPSVISMIPSLIERSGPGKNNEGTITSFYTVLADSDDHNDPVVDGARAILDGHIVLSREKAQLGIYPAVDIPNSLSRVMNEITDIEHQRAATEFRKLISIYDESKDLVMMGGYNKGQDPSVDRAHSAWPSIVEFIKQDQSTSSSFTNSKDNLIKTMQEQGVLN